METARAPIDADVRLIVRRGKDGSHHHFEVTDDVDVEGYIIALEVTDEA